MLNALGPVIVQATLQMGNTILGVSDLSFIGLGIEAPIPEWGSMLAEARAQMMKGANVMDGDAQESLAVYYHACSMLVNCQMLSYFGAVLANNGCTPKANEKVLEPKVAYLLRVLMASCGLYTKAGEFAFRVGQPACM